MIVFDLDGTLADLTHRLHFIDGTDGKKDWDNFHLACEYDEPIGEMVDVFNSMIHCFGYDVKIWTCRPEWTRVLTEDWLTRHTDFSSMKFGGLDLIMRPEGDKRKDVKVKRDFIEWHGEPYLVFEDRKGVVDMYRSLGIRVCHVDDGDY